MYPILDVGPLAVQLPGLLLLLGFWLGLSLAGRRAKAAGLSEDMIFSAGMIALLAGLVGARLGYVALRWSAYEGDRWGMLAPTSGALYAPTGLLAGLGAAAFYLSIRRPPLRVLLDALAPGLALTLVFVSLADLSSGAAYGEVCDLPWAIQLWGARRHPTQLYEMSAALLALGALALAWPARNRPWFYDGFFFLLFLLVFGAARLFFDAFRADPWLLPGGLRAVQALGLGAVLSSLWLMSQQVVEHD
jgi:prolipoprotein diacylglyceryltransferase